MLDGSGRPSLSSIACWNQSVGNPESPQPETITNVPLSGDSGKTAVTPKGYVPPAGQSLQGHYSYAVTGDYFTALGIPSARGQVSNFGGLSSRGTGLRGGRRFRPALLA